MANEDLLKTVKSKSIIARAQEPETGISDDVLNKYALKDTELRQAISCYLKPELVKRLKTLSRQTGRTVSNLVELAVEECWISKG